MHALHDGGAVANNSQADPAGEFVVERANCRSYHPLRHDFSSNLENHPSKPPQKNTPQKERTKSRKKNMRLRFKLQVSDWHGIMVPLRQ